MAIVDEYKDALLRRLSMVRGVDADQAEHDAISQLLATADQVGR